MEIYNVKDLSSILFYTGEHANQAAQVTENRQYGAYVEGLGQLTKTNDGLTTWSAKPNIKFEETTPNFNKLGDIYEAANSYATKYYEDYPLGTVNIADNRYNALYTYNGDLNNDFSTAETIVTSDLKNFLLAINEQVFNKQKYYGDTFEVNSITIGPTAFTWYPIGHVAYTYTYQTEHTEWSYEWTVTKFDTEESYTTAYTDENVDILHSYFYIEDEEGSVIYNKAEVSYSYSYAVTDNHAIDYVIGGDYYSYVRQTYNTIDETLFTNIKTQLDAFAEKYEPTMYAYYMYDCIVDFPMTLDSNSIGGKRKSTFQIRFDSDYNKWFTYNIAVKAIYDEESEEDTLSVPMDVVSITSAVDNAVFSIRKNESDTMGEENILLNAGEKHTFTTNVKIGEDDHISILTPHNIKVLDFSPMKEHITGILDLTNSGWIHTKGNHLEQLIMSNDDVENETLTKILGVNELIDLKYINIENYKGLNATPSITTLNGLKVYKANNSSISNFKPAQKAVLNYVSLPSGLKLIKMVDVKFEEGTVDIDGVETKFDGVLDYTPNDKLKSVTLNNVEGINTFKFINNWYRSISDLSDNVYYLDITGFNWGGAPIDFVLDIRKFDVNQINGTIKVIGTGNYGWLSRSDYQNIIRAYGLNALAAKEDLNARKHKIFPELFLTSKGRETFEYSLGVTNVNWDEYKATHADEYIEHRSNLTLTIEDTRAGNAFLDLLTAIPEEEEDGVVTNGFEFTWDANEHYAYCTLANSIDTKDSDEVSDITAGDIMLYNGDTVVIFAETIKNSVYEYVKIGHINDIETSGVGTLKKWFDTEGTSMLQFIPAERPIVVSTITTEGSNYVYDNGDESELTITVNVDHPEAENNRIVAKYDDTVLEVTVVGEEPSEETEEDTEGTETTPTNFTYPRVYKVKSVNKHIDVAKVATKITFASEVNEIDTAVEHEIDIVQYNEPASVTNIDGKNIILLNNAKYHVTEDGILVIARDAASIDESNNTLSID